jgi:hypothetical protein
MGYALYSLYKSKNIFSTIWIKRVSKDAKNFIGFKNIKFSSINIAPEIKLLAKRCFRNYIEGIFVIRHLNICSETALTGVTWFHCEFVHHWNENC